MLSRSKPSISEQKLVNYTTHLTYILEELTGLEYFKTIWTTCSTSFLFGVLYLSSLLLHVYKRKNDLNGDYSSKLWDNGRQMVVYLWDLYGKLWHGYELHGVEKIPEGPGLIVYYHGATPIDYLYFIARLCNLKGRLCHSVADHFTFKIPGIKLLLDIFGVMHGGREECVQILKNGHLLGVSPGGVREAFFSDENYNLLWGNRKGFAQVAIDAKVPIIPMFTQNLREGYRTLGKIWSFRWLYEYSRLPIVPLYGGFPVKFRTYIGDPIPYDPNITAAELTEKAKTAIQSLRDMHQKTPGNILRALLERFDKND
ncbi:DGAT1/2-independent enzyme synthesizing storage lipids-like [Carettochelys insculpta]|uniref:DGAT1/2-independent enzyme synthesizing storage lipids-like n=1 Tax=Carettochelys insculpta TaxID=44489 RepID=UPI003EB87466